MPNIPLVPFSVCMFVGGGCVYVFGGVGGVCMWGGDVCVYMLPLQTENGSPGNFPESFYCLLIVQTDVC